MNLPLNCYVRASIPGTPFWTLADTAGRFFLTDVPPATYDVCIEYGWEVSNSLGYSYHIFVRTDTLNADVSPDSDGFPDTLVVSY